MGMTQEQIRQAQVQAQIQQAPVQTRQMEQAQNKNQASRKSSRTKNVQPKSSLENLKEISTSDKVNNRRFDRDQRYYIDLFKLMPSNMLRKVWVAGENSNVIYVPQAHVHYYRTRDSDGKFYLYSEAMGGHVHEVIINKDQKGNLTATCGPALDFSRKKRLQPLQIINEFQGKKQVTPDTHIHDVMFFKSQEVKARVKDMDAQLFMAKTAVKVPAPQGAVETTRG